MAHSDDTGGHCGVKSILTGLYRSVTWPNINCNATDFVRSVSNAKDNPRNKDLELNSTLYQL